MLPGFAQTEMTTMMMMDRGGCAVRLIRGFISVVVDLSHYSEIDSKACSESDSKAHPESNSKAHSIDLKHP
jgi:hypothetical protein